MFEYGKRKKRKHYFCISFFTFSTFVLSTWSGLFDLYQPFCQRYKYSFVLLRGGFAQGCFCCLLIAWNVVR